VEKDGVLKGTTNIDDYPQIKTRWEGTEEMWTAAFVNAEGVTGLTISGEGTIDGSGEEWVTKNPDGARAAAPRGSRRLHPGAPAAGGAAAAAVAPMAPPARTARRNPLHRPPAPWLRRPRARPLPALADADARA
jgi:hypothetical protein